MLAKSQLIIGVTGTFAAGKDAVAEYLVSRGFHLVSTSDLVRQYIRDHQWGELDRDNLRRSANRLRRELGLAYLVDQAVGMGLRPLVITGIRNPGEVERIHELGGNLIAVDAPVEQRYQRAKLRGRVDDAVTQEQFRVQESIEVQAGEPHQIQLTAVIAMADFIIANDGTLEQLQTKVDEVLTRLGWQK